MRSRRPLNWQNRSFHVLERTRTSSKCQKMKNARAKRAKILFFIVKYANLWGFCCRRRRRCLKLPIRTNRRLIIQFWVKHVRLHSGNYKVVYEWPLLIKCKTVNFLLKIFPCFLCFFCSKRERDKRPEMLLLIGLTSKKKFLLFAFSWVEKWRIWSKEHVVCFSSYRPYFITTTYSASTCVKPRVCHASYFYWWLENICDIKKMDILSKASLFGLPVCF